MAVAEARTIVAGDYEMDESNTRIGFAARYAMVTTVRGEFGEFSGCAHLDPEAVTRSWATITILAASLTTAQAQRDDHLRSPDFLDVETYPEILFRSTEVMRSGATSFRVTGDLTICGVTQPVLANFVLEGSSIDASGRDLVGFTGDAVISRSDFGLTWNAALETGGVLVGDEVSLQFDVALVRMAASSGSNGDAPAPPGHVSRRRRGWRWRD